MGKKKLKKQIAELTDLLDNNAQHHFEVVEKLIYGTAEEKLSIQARHEMSKQVEKMIWSGQS